MNFINDEESDEESDEERLPLNQQSKVDSLLERAIRNANYYS